MSEVNPRDLIVTYGTRSIGQKGYILAIRATHPYVAVFESDRKSEVIEEAQRRKGWEPVNGDEQTYARQIAEHKGEAR